MKTIIRRPSRYQQVRAKYELTASGLAMANAISAVRQAEGTPRQETARQTLNHAKRRISAGQGVNGTRQTPTLEAIC